ncbi:MAG: Protein of unknown function (DUF3160) [Candidatus Kentron sp. G]|nr:MAG: Protein of unknown function (DUF3160) [Candidatus Kentron sp. G]VFM99423.1 MAG: Protein of unknown function (DUF3160) [Candidatus Kentron sp. G]VFN01546.1 MAG: Protein of unknown function (DUF3160) [Candidatus Kentron sp. G]
MFSHHLSCRLFVFPWFFVFSLFFFGRLSHAEGIDLVIAPGEGDTGDGFFALYEENRRFDIPNYITVDFLAQSYSRIRLAEQSRLERETIASALGSFVSGLTALAEENAKAEHEAGRELSAHDRANLTWFRILGGLLSGKAPESLDAVGKQEYESIERCAGVSPSPLWGYAIDYSQFKPRGVYDTSDETRAFFRAWRYAGAIRLGIVASPATGLTEAMADRQFHQARALAGMLRDETLAGHYRKLAETLDWHYGQVRNIVPAMAACVTGADKTGKEMRLALLDRAQRENRQPRVLDGVVDGDKLGAYSAADVLTGIRLIGLRENPDSIALQGLVWRQTGERLSDTQVSQYPPFGLSIIGGRPVKGYPLLAELLAMAGDGATLKRLQTRGETAFQGYEQQFEKGKRILADAGGLPGLHLALTRVWFGDVPDAARESLPGFWTEQRYIEVLYSAQPATATATATGKGMVFPMARPGARVEAAPAAFAALAKIAREQENHGGSEVWASFAGMLERLTELAGQTAGQKPLDEGAQAFLNGLDTVLLRLIGGRGEPWVVDIHTNPAEGKVLQEATGYARQVIVGEGKRQARGARYSHYEFKQPLANRLTDRQWRRWLKKHAPGRELVAIKSRLDRALTRRLLLPAGADDETVLPVEIILEKGVDEGEFRKALATLGIGVKVSEGAHVFIDLPAKSLLPVARLPGIWSMAVEEKLFEPLEDKMQTDPASGQSVTEQSTVKGEQN